jgi:transcriptional regulator with XRE-family HTH domain
LNSSQALATTDRWTYQSRFAYNEIVSTEHLKKEDFLMHNDSELGRRIAALRKEKGYTQEKIGDLLKVTPQAISKWEQGNAFPDTLLLPPLARLLGVSIDYLLTGESAAGKAGPYDGEYRKEEFYWGIDPRSLLSRLRISCRATRKTDDCWTLAAAKAGTPSILPNAVSGWMPWRFPRRAWKKSNIIDSCQAMRFVSSRPT